MPKLSFVMPCYNAYEWIGECLQSLLTQTERDIEIIIVEDCSTDGTREWLKDYEANRLAPLFPYDERVKFIFNETNIGAGASRNKGTEIASAPIIGICDADDIYADQRAELIIKHFELNPKSEMVNFPYICIGYYNEHLEEFGGEPFNHEQFLKTGNINYFSNPSMAVRKSSLVEVGGYGQEVFNEKERTTDDYALVSKWVKAGKIIDFQPGYCVTFHRNLQNSMMTKVRGWSADWVQK